jgi:hypothetical protein
VIEIDVSGQSEIGHGSGGCFKVEVNVCVCVSINLALPNISVTPLTYTCPMYVSFVTSTPP